MNGNRETLLIERSIYLSIYIDISYRYKLKMQPENHLAPESPTISIPINGDSDDNGDDIPVTESKGLPPLAPSRVTPRWLRSNL